MDEAYTEADHGFRENDLYAAAKYHITLRWLGGAGGRRLLNIGCGSGLFNRLATDAGFVVEACEPDPIAYRMAADDAPPGVTVHNSGVLELTPERKADVVVMHDVLEHIDAESAVLDHVARLVAPGGQVVISVPAMPRLYGYHDEHLGHYRRYSGGALRVAMQRRFTVDRLRYFGATFIPVTYWFSHRRRQAYPTVRVGHGGAVGRAFRLACAVEARVPTPIGTSLLCLAHPSLEGPRSQPPSI